jgi:hypothetical protein
MALSARTLVVAAVVCGVVLLASLRLRSREEALTLATLRRELSRHADGGADSLEELREELASFAKAAGRGGSAVAGGVTRAVLREELNRLRAEHADALERLSQAHADVVAAAVARVAPPQAVGGGALVAAGAAASGGAGIGHPLGYCKRNAYLSGWDDAAFARAAAAVADFRTSLIRKGHNSHWGVGGHARFGLNPDVQECHGKMQRLGEGDGGKWVCNLEALKPGGTILSIGSDYNTDWERDILKVSPCEVYTFDCTVRSRGRVWG